MTTRTMYDSVTVADIPPSATMVAGYIDGRYANMPAIRARFPHALHVTITVRGQSLDAQVIDCETGDATPAQAAAWAKQKVARHEHPTIYCNSSTWPKVKAAVKSAGLSSSQVSYWIAHYDNDPAILAGAVAKQYRSTTKPNLDTSSVAAYWPGVDPAPVTKAPAPSKTPPKATAQPAPKHPAPAPTPAQRRASLLHRMHLAYLAKLHRLHLAALKRRTGR